MATSSSFLFPALSSLFRQHSADTSTSDQDDPDDLNGPLSSSSTSSLKMDGSFVLTDLAQSTTMGAEAEGGEYILVDGFDRLVANEIDLAGFAATLSPEIVKSLELLRSKGHVRSGAESRTWSSVSASSVLDPAFSLEEVYGAVPGFPGKLNITCLTIGTRGDVQPFVALCKGLMAQGHRCRIATHAEYQGFVEGHGIEFRVVGGNPAELMQLCVNNGMFSLSFIREGVFKFSGFIKELLDTAWVACQGSDVLIGTPSSMAGIHIAESLGIPFVYGFPFPWTRTVEFPHPFSSSETAMGDAIGSAFNSLTRGGLNYMSYILIDKILWTGTMKQVNSWRTKTLGLPAITTLDDTGVPMLYAFSSQILKKPADWTPWVNITGYWFLDESHHNNFTPPPDLVNFIKKGSKPVYIGFGSIVVDDPAALTKIVVDAVKKAGVRAVIAKGWSTRSLDPKKPKKEEAVAWPDTIFPLSQVPHDWLFPQMAGVVHHGGAGTTAAGLKAGCPTVIKPFFGDQLFWAARVTDLGVGLNLRHLTVDALAEALTTITTNTEMQREANLLGERLRAEDGVGEAIQQLYRALERMPEGRRPLPKASSSNSNSNSSGSPRQQVPVPWNYRVDPHLENETEYVLINGNGQ